MPKVRQSHAYHHSSGDGNAMLHELYWWTTELKSNTEIILVTDKAVDKVFRDKKTSSGSSKSISEGAARVFSSPENKIWYLGLTAVAVSFSF